MMKDAREMTYLLPDPELALDIEPTLGSFVVALIPAHHESQKLRVKNTF